MAHLKSRRPVRRFFHRRIHEFYGLGLIATSLFVAISLLTHNSADPSFNRSFNGEINNFAGTPGAFLSDLLLQIMGLSALALITLPLIWGIHYLNKRPPNKLPLRLSLLIVSIPFLSGFFAALPTPLSWPIPAGMGGYIGWMIKNALYSPITPPLFFILTTTASLTCLSFATGLNREQWSNTLQFLSATSQRAIYVTGNVTQFFYQAVTDHQSLKPRKVNTISKPKEAPIASVFKGKGTGKKAQVATEEKPSLAIKRKITTETASSSKDTQSSLALNSKHGGFSLPSVSLLSVAKTNKKRSALSDAALEQNARMLESVLEDFGVHGEIINVRPGPVVTLYELQPAPGIKSSRVIGLSDDIARSMSSISARIAVIPGKNAIGIELPNQSRETVYLREMLESKEYKDNRTHLPLTLGKDIGGDPIIVDLAKMPHLLVAGTTGSGKSVAINTMLLSLIYHLSPDECKFIMIDPKMLELSVYDGIPHLLTPVVTEPGKAVVALKWAVKEMENRYRLMSNLGVRNIDGYNKRIREAAARGEELKRKVQTGFDPETGKPIIEEVMLEMSPLPYIVVIVDEMADLMLVAGKDIESSIQRLAQMARAAGIHLVMATQRPSVDVITGVIKANFPTRISFQVTSRIDSRTILGEMGAEQLLGMGDMLYMSGGSRIQRVHGPFVSDEEVEKVISHLKAQGEPTYIEDVTIDDGSSVLGYESSGSSDGNSDDDLFDKAVAIVCSDGRASTSYIQRKLRIGYNRAATLIERMEEEGVISAPNHVGKREVLARHTMEDVI